MLTRGIIRLNCLAAGLLLAATAEAQAADASAPDSCSAPCIDYSGSAEMTAVVNGLRGGDRWSEVDPKIETEITARATDSLSVFANIVTEPVLDPVPGHNRVLRDIGTYAEVLQLKVELGDVTLIAGKIHPVFGRAWDVAPGINGKTLAESYELSERIGAGGSWAFDLGGMNTSLSASAFTIDRTALSNSLFTQRGRTTLADGGAGNTSGISSAAIALDGCMGADPEACFDEGTWGYQIAARFQRGGEGSDGGESGLLGSLNRTFDLPGASKLRLLGELGWFRHFHGDTDNALTATAAASLEHDDVTYALTYAQSRTLPSKGTADVEHVLDASISYALGDVASIAGERWTLTGDFTLHHTSGSNERIVGLKLLAEF